MRTFLAAAMIAVMPLAVYAQGMGGGMGGGKGRHRHAQSDDSQKKKGKDIDTKAILDKLPDLPYDPWRTMRGSEPEKTAKSPN